MAKTENPDEINFNRHYRVVGEDEWHDGNSPRIEEILQTGIDRCAKQGKKRVRCAVNDS